MKRANIRARSNGGTNSRGSQPQTKPQPATEPAGKENPAMVIARQEDGGEWARVECRPELFALMEAAVQKCGLSPAAFIMQAMEEKLSLDAPPTPSPARDLQEAINQSGLTHLVMIRPGDRAVSGWCRRALPLELENQLLEKRIHSDDLLEFAEQALREKVARSGSLPSLPTDELENAICMAQALNELLEHRICNPGDGGEYCENIQVGLVVLGSETFTRLRLAAEAVAAGKDGAR